jgi:hypothetical protein
MVWRHFRPSEVVRRSRRYFCGWLLLIQIDLVFQDCHVDSAAALPQRPHAGTLGQFRASGTPATRLPLETGNAAAHAEIGGHCGTSARCAGGPRRSPAPALRSRLGRTDRSAFDAPIQRETGAAGGTPALARQRRRGLEATRASRTRQPPRPLSRRQLPCGKRSGELRPGGSLLRSRRPP